MSPKLGGMADAYQPGPQTSSIEATAYASLALLAHGDKINASESR